MKIAINGFGRIGRLAMRVIIERGLLERGVEIVAINDVVSSKTLAYLFKHDSVHGKFPDDVTAGEDSITVGEHVFKTLMVKGSPSALPWADLGIDLVIESTGLFTQHVDAKGHLEAGAKKVLISTASEDSDGTIIMGVNDSLIDYDSKSIFSTGSCTTNCASSIMSVLLKEGMGVKEVLLTTIHSYIAGQSLIDAPNEKHLREGRAGAINIIPFIRGSIEAVAKSIPELEGKITGISVRVPTPDVSMIDVSVVTERPTSLDEITSAMRKASTSYLRGILDVTDEEVVSSDFIHSPFSAIYDVKTSTALNDHFFKLIAWYDNEWGHSNRIGDIVEKIKNRV